MDYEEYVKKIRQQAKEELGYTEDMMEFYPRGYVSEDPEMLEWIRDGNLRFAGLTSDILLTDILLLKKKAPGSGVMRLHRIPTERCWSRKKDLEDIFKEIREDLALTDKATYSKEALDKRSSGVYEEIRDRLIIRPLNYRLHELDLRGRLYHRRGDIAFVLYQLVGDNKDVLTTSKILKEELKVWGVDILQVMEDALNNTARLYPACVYDKKTHREVDLLKTDLAKQDIMVGDGQTLISTFKTVNGAIALFYPGVVTKLMQIFGGPFYAVFMNINDVMIFERNDVRTRAAAKSAKQSSSMGEMLSGRRYLCDENGINPVP